MGGDIKERLLLFLFFYSQKHSSLPVESKMTWLVAAGIIWGNELLMGQILMALFCAVLYFYLLF
jgi:hypothetical protein